MPSYKTPQEDISFVLHEVLNAEQLNDLPGYEGMADRDTMDAIIEAAGKMAEEVLQPLNLPADAEGCHYENGIVRTPKGFKEAYDQWVEGGWTSLSAEEDYGGSGMPHLYKFVLDEIVSAANTSFGMYPGLTHGAVEAMQAHASEELKQRFLPKMIDGSWGGTMCLTEAQCGTDLGLIRTKAVPREDGDGYDISGQKIFISAGEHDLTENIIHLVLAKLPDAPEGVRGISLFVVPKIKVSEDGSELGARNGVSCGSIEHKMGIKASATCVMNFDEAQGWLVGEAHKGLRAMFVMMNAARLSVGMQGLGLAEVAYQNAVDYAVDRVQGRSLTGTKAKDKAADPIIVHPDVRKNLMTAKAFNEGARALAYWTGIQIDTYSKHADPKVRQEAEDLVALLTPVIKGYFTDMATSTAIMQQQVYGGHGYIHEWGMEQFVRDARITQIYEGANGIQALDLVGRKMPAHFGRYLRRFFHPVQKFIEDNMNNPELATMLFPFAKAFGKLQQSTALIAQKGMKNPDEAGAASTDYMRMFGLVALGYMWLQMVQVAMEKKPDANGRAKFYDGKIKTAQFFFDKMLPETDALFKTIMAGGDTLMALDEDQF
ncbi:MAG: acyl-CoA dehydrogenase C-terminal domain-containing protein [Alphaproteobacteria bacterium]